MLACYYPQGQQLASGVIGLLTCQSHYNTSVINTTPCIQCTYRTHNLQPGKTPPQVSADHIFFPKQSAKCPLPYGLAVRIPGFHPGGPGSTPGMGSSFRFPSAQAPSHERPQQTYRHATAQ